jgi:hypothetical protein
MNTASIIERDFDDPAHDELIKYYNEEILNIIPMIIRDYGYKEKIFHLLYIYHIIGVLGFWGYQGSPSARVRQWPPARACSHRQEPARLRARDGRSE